MQPQVHILLLGSGLMAQCVVSYLLKKPYNHIHIASNIVQDAEKIALKISNQKITFSSIDVLNDKQKLNSLVNKAHIVISYIPAFLHIHVAKCCLQLNKNLVTASYVSSQMQALDEAAKAKGLIFLNELGLDPGIDHLATMKIVDETRQNKGIIKGYQSWCGGLPSPKYCDNPLGYKFTWSPIGAFRSFKNDAVFLNDSKEITIQGKDLLYHKKNIKLNQALTLEGYPNRNSINYKKIYGLNDAINVLRGTLRYEGFCWIINAWKQLGILDESAIKGQTWSQYIQNKVKEQKGNTLEQKLKQRIINNQNYKNQTLDNKQKIFIYILKAMKYFGLLDQNKFHNKQESNLQNLIKLLQPKLKLKQGQTDMIAMQHIFKIQYQNKKVTLKSSLIEIGQKNSFSAMAKTVATPTAIGAQLILDNKIKQIGVIRPIYPDIYNPVLQELEKQGIKLVEVIQEQ